MYSRRTWLKAGAVSLVGGSTARLLRSQSPLLTPPSLAIRDPEVKALAMQALDAARHTGATYADVRLSYTRDRNYVVNYGSSYNLTQRESLTVGVRALVNGYWGFAAGRNWSGAGMNRLGAEAVHQAHTNALGQSRTVHLAPMPVLADGHWTMPVVQDPFEVHPVEVLDFLRSLMIYIERHGGSCFEIGAGFHAHDIALGTSEGHYSTQRLYRSHGNLTIIVPPHPMSRTLDILTPAGLGWELFRNSKIHEEIRTALEELNEDGALPVKPVEPGRSALVIGAPGVARLASATIGAASEIDRVLGYEANATGTSYLRSPTEMLGVFAVGGPVLNVTANRSEPGGAATVQWDAEGVAPQEYTLVRNGQLADFLTSREGVGWLTGVYQRRNIPIQSKGCASAPAAIDVPLVHTPNLVITPGSDTATFHDLLQRMMNGIAFRSPRFNIDFQQLGGLGYGDAYEIRQGKIVARLANAGILFRTPEIWHRISALGGVSSARRIGLSTVKGEPRQTGFHSMTAVPILVTDTAVIDAKRKA